LDPEGIANQLRELVSAIHERGVFHLDLRQSQNLLLSSNSELFCVDFGAAWVPGPFGSAFLARVFASVDSNAVVKWLARFSPELLTAEEARRLLRGKFWRRLWFVSPHTDRGETAAARRRLLELEENPKN
jgi:serine/threonine protein kinase